MWGMDPTDRVPDYDVDAVDVDADDWDRWRADLAELAGNDQ